MILAFILILNFSSPLSEENAVGVRFQSHIEYKFIGPVFKKYVYFILEEEERSK